jgi:hypothetical protein
MRSTCMGTREMQKLPRVNSVELKSHCHLPSVGFAKPVSPLLILPAWKLHAEGVLVDGSTHKAIHEPWNG